MKTKLLYLAFITLNVSFSQTNGWHQVKKSGESFAIDVDSNGNIHLGSDAGYIAYSPIMEMVFSYANLTSQDSPVDKVRTIKVNPVNSEIAMLTNGGNSITLYDGMTTYTNYNVANSDFEPFGIINFRDARFSYGDQGILYIYHSEDTRYQTFENGTFNPSQSLSFHPMDIVESNDGSKVYFASETTGLWELDKATDSFTNFNTSNSDLHTNFLTCLYKDSSGLIYAGGTDGISTYDPSTNMFDLVYQEAWSVNPAVIFDVESIEVFSDGRFLVKTQPLTWAILDLSNDVYTHYDNNDFCNPRNVAIADDEIYVQPAFGELTVFDPNTVTCTEKDTNHLNVGDIGLFGALGIAIRPTPNNANNVDVLWTNNAICGPTTTCSMYSLTLPLNFSGGPFADANAEISVSDAGLNQIAVLDVNNQTTVVVGETNGYRILEEDGTQHTIAHGIDGFRPFQNEFVVQGQNSDNPPATPKIAVLSGGFDSNNEYTNYIGNINIDNNTLSNVSEISLTNPATSNTRFAGQHVSPHVEILMLIQSTNSNRYAVGIEWDFDNGTYQIPFEDDISLLTENVTDPFKRYRKMWFQGTSSNQLWTRNADTNMYESENFDINDDGTNDTYVATTVRPNNTLTPGQIIFAFVAFAIRPDISEKGISIGANLISGSNRRSSNTFELLENSGLGGLPSDFFILDSYIYLYNETHLAVALSTTYGLLVNPAIDYSSLTLSTDDVVLNEKNVLIYPNPAGDVVSFSDETIEKIELFDIKGIKVLEVNNNSSFSIKSLAKGIYIVKAIKSDGATISEKLIKI